MVGVDIVDAQVGEVVVAAKSTGMHIVRAPTEHDEAIVLAYKDPSFGLCNDLKAECGDIEGCRLADIVYSENMVILEDGHAEDLWLFRRPTLRQRFWKGTRLPTKTGMPLRISGSLWTTEVLLIGASTNRLDSTPRTSLRGLAPGQAL